VTPAERKKPSVRTSLLTPTIPTCIRTDGGQSIPVEDLDDAVLRAVAKNWTALLLLSARNKRKARTPK